MQKGIKENLADIYLSRLKTKEGPRLSYSKRSIFFIAITFIALSIFGILLVLVLNL